MQQSCLRRISPWLSCYSVHTQLRPGLINLSNMRRLCEMPAQPSHCHDMAKGEVAGGSGQIMLPTAGRALESSETEPWVKGAGHLLIYGSQAVIAKVSHCSVCLFFPLREARPLQQHSTGCRAAPGQCRERFTLLPSASMPSHHPTQIAHVTSNPTAPRPG